MLRTVIHYTLLMGFPALWCFWSFFAEPNSIKVREYRVSVPRLEESLAGVRVAVLADIHAGSAYINAGKLRRIVNLTNAAKPDIILIPGDIVSAGGLGSSYFPTSQIAEELKRLKAPLGVWAVLGHHDVAQGAGKIKAALAKASISVLEDAAVTISTRGTYFWLVGISDARVERPNVKKALGSLNESATAIVFTHSPDVFPDIPYRVNLTIAGHTHGGQVYIPVVGRPVTSSVYGQRYSIGKIVENEKHMFVSSGIGTGLLPIRFMTPPEITILVLKAAKDKARK